MTFKSIHKLFLITYLSIGYNFLYASTPSQDTPIYLSSPTLISGAEYIHINRESQENNSLFTPKTQIYIAANTIFAAPDEVLQQLVIVNDTPKTKEKVKDIVPKQSTAVVKTEVIEKQSPLPLDSIPNKNTNNYGVATPIFLLTSQTKTSAMALALLPKTFDYLIDTPHNQNQNLSFGYLFIGKTNSFFSHHTTRPPPVNTIL